MGLFPDASFTHLLRDGSREGLGRYAEAVKSAVAAWEGIDVAEVKFRPTDPLKSWCPPVESGERTPDSRSVECRFAASDTVRKWYLSLERAGYPHILGALFPDDSSDSLHEGADWRGYCDHLIETSIADTVRYDSGGFRVYGFASGILLEARLRALSGQLPSRISASETSPYGVLIRSVEEALGGGSRRAEIVSVDLHPQEKQRFLARWDDEVLERLGADEFAQLLAPLGLTLKQWREPAVEKPPWWRRLFGSSGRR